MACPFTKHSPHDCVWQNLVSQGSFLWFGGCLLEPPTLPFKVCVREVSRREWSCFRQWIFPVLGFLEMCPWFETREGSGSDWCHHTHLLWSQQPLHFQIRQHMLSQEKPAGCRETSPAWTSLWEMMEREKSKFSLDF